MRKWAKIAAGAVIAAVVLGVAALGTGLALAGARMHRTVHVPARAVAYTADAAAIERGRYLYASRGCVDCHGANGGGRVFLDDGKGLRIRGSNLTAGPGSAVRAYRPQDWDRAIRHGVAPDGRPLLIMPSEDYNRWTDADLAALVAFVRSLPAVAGEPALVELPLIVRALYGFGLVQDAAAKIDHALPPQAPVPEGVNVAHGAYVANMCLGCHGPQLAGGRIPGAPPEWPAASDLRPGSGVMGRYPDGESLVRLFRSGQRADGSRVAVMPFESLREMSDTDVHALHLYLRSLPPAPR